MALRCRQLERKWARSEIGHSWLPAAAVPKSASRRSIVNADSSVMGQFQHIPSLHPVHQGLRSTFIGILANTLLAATKGIAGVLGNSYALIADAIESTTDIASSFIVWGGSSTALPPDVDHPYGHGKAEPLAAVVVSLTLIAAAIGIVIQSIREIVTPHHAPAAFTLAVLVLVVVAKEYPVSIRFQGWHWVGNSLAVKSDAWHHRSDAITSAAAFIGISVALVGGRGYEGADDWAAMFAATVIVFNAVRILRPAVSEIMDAAPPAEFEDAIRQIARRVRRCHRAGEMLHSQDGVLLLCGSSCDRRRRPSRPSGSRHARQVKHTIRTAYPDSCRRCWCISNHLTCSLNESGRSAFSVKSWTSHGIRETSVYPGAFNSLEDVKRFGAARRPSCRLT